MGRPKLKLLASNGVATFVMPFSKGITKIRDTSHIGPENINIIIMSAPVATVMTMPHTMTTATKQNAKLHCTRSI